MLIATFSWSDSRFTLMSESQNIEYKSTWRVEYLKWVYSLKRTIQDSSQRIWYHISIFANLTCGEENRLF